MPAEKTKGRQRKTPQVSHERVKQLFSAAKIKEREQTEFLTLLSELFCQSYKNTALEEAIENRYPPYVKWVRSAENLWDMLREAARRGLLVPKHTEDASLVDLLERHYAWLKTVTVVESPHVNSLARSAAEQIVSAIRDIARSKNKKKIHLGFAGGRTIRAVAEAMSDLLAIPHGDDPDELVFHAMVAGFDDEDFFADPNSFITYFVNRPYHIKIKFVRLPLPGIIETEHYAKLQEIPSVSAVYARADELDLIVTSGGIIEDPSSTLQMYWHCVEQSENTNRDDFDSILEDKGIVGDLIWQPVSRSGPEKLDLDLTINTLIDLDRLAAFVGTDHRVFLILGCSGESNLPKSNLLQSVLGFDTQLITDLVVDSPTAAGCFSTPGRRSQRIRNTPR